MMENHNCLSKPNNVFATVSAIPIFGGSGNLVYQLTLAIGTARVSDRCGRRIDGYM